MSACKPQPGCPQRGVICHRRPTQWSHLRNHLDKTKNKVFTRCEWMPIYHFKCLLFPDGFSSSLPISTFPCNCGKLSFYNLELWCAKWVTNKRPPTGHVPRTADSLPWILPKRKGGQRTRGSFLFFSCLASRDYQGSQKWGYCPQTSGKLCPQLIHMGYGIGLYPVGNCEPWSVKTPHLSWPDRTFQIHIIEFQLLNFTVKQVSHTQLPVWGPG